MLIADIDGSQSVGENLRLNQQCSFVLDGKRCTTLGQRSKLTPTLTPEFYTKCNLRKGFTQVLSDWIKGLVLNFGVNLWCYPKTHCIELLSTPYMVISVVNDYKTASPKHLMCCKHCALTITVLWPFVRIYPGEPVQKKHSPTHTYLDHQPLFIIFFHLLWSIASSVFNLRAWQSFVHPPSKSSLVYLLVWNTPLHTPYISSPNHCLRNTCYYHRNMFCCSTNIMSSIPVLQIKKIF